jgi:coronin-7
LIFDEHNLAGGPIHSITLDTSPSILIPIFDMDTGVLTLVGRGESAFLFYEIEKDLTPTYLNRYVAPGITTAFYPLPKIGVDVADVEILKGFRTTQTSVEIASIKVPRVKKDYFQDDIFSDTLDYKNSAVKFADWQKTDSPIKLVKVSIQPPSHPKKCKD